MKKHIHPTYRAVVFHDTTANEYYKVGSTIHTDKTITLEGQTYPYVTIEISAASHPVYTGRQKKVINEGRVARFEQRFANMLNAKNGAS